MLIVFCNQFKRMFKSPNTYTSGTYSKVQRSNHQQSYKKFNLNPVDCDVAENYPGNFIGYW